MANEIYRTVNSSVWGNNVFHALNSVEKNLYFFFLTSEKTKELGIFEVSPFELACYLSSNSEMITPNEVIEMLKKFEELNLIKYDFEHNAVYVKFYSQNKVLKGFIEFQIYSADIEACIRKGLKGLVDAYFDDIKDTIVSPQKYAAFVLAGKYNPAEFTAVDYSREEIIVAISEKKIQKFDLSVFDAMSTGAKTPSPSSLKDIYSDDFSFED